MAIFVLSMASYSQWTEQASGFTNASRGINYMSLVTSKICWAVAYDGSGGGAYINEFTRTYDGGNTWLPGQVLGGSTYGLGNLCAINKDTAFADVYNGVGAQDNTCGVYRTTDGGATWTQLPGALQGAASFADNVYFWDYNNGIAHGDVLSGYFEIYTTTDGGSTWTRVPQANINATVASGEGGWTGVIEAVGDSTIMFGTNKGKIYISNDRGFHWSGVATGIVPAGTNPGVNHIAFVDKLHGLVAQSTTSNGSLELFETSNGGTTWAPVTFTGDAFNNALRPVRNTANTYVTTGAATGFDGVTYSFDGGHTWSDMVSTIGTQYLANQWLNDSVSFVGGFNTDASTGGMSVFTEVLAAPVPDFAGTPVAIALDGTVNFTNLSTGNQAVNNPTYLWTFTGGTPATSTLKNPPAIAYHTSGTFNVSLKLTTDWGTKTTLKTGYIYVGGLGVDELSQGSIKVYPNPIKDVVNIESGSGIQKVEILNITGQVVINHQVDGKIVTLNTSSLKSGVYFLKVTTESGSFDKKIVIQ
jgi:photosystem II stability/assembly factor-like uncharacterized protein